MNRSRALLTTAIAVVVGAAGAAATALGGTDAALSDAEPGAPSVVAAAEVVLGGDGSGPDLPFGALEPGEAATVELTVDYRGTVPADVELAVAPGGAPACTQDGSTWQPQSGAAFTIAIGDADPVGYCDLYDAAPLPLGAVAPGEAPVVALTVARDAGGAPEASFTADDVVTVRASAGFVDEVDGRISFGATPTPAVPGGTPPPTPGPPDPLAAASAPASDPAATPAPTPPPTPGPTAPPPAPAVEVPQECAAAGLTAESFVDVVVLDAAAPAFDAAGRDGPLLVLGSPGNDTITGSAGADCIVGADGDDRLSGGPGDDVLAGGAGADVLRGDAGADRLDGGPAADDLDGGAGADHVDGGPDGGVCPAEPAGATERCAPAQPQPAAEAAQAVPPTAAAVAPQATEPPPAPKPVPEEQAEPEPSTEQEPADETTAPALEPTAVDAAGNEEPPA